MNTWVGRFLSAVPLMLLLLSCGGDGVNDLDSPPSQRPPGPANPHPKDGEGSVSPLTHLSWNHAEAASGPLRYDIYLGAADDPPLVEDDHGQRFFFPEALDPGVRYAWKVVVTDDHGQETVGPLWSFQVAEASPNARPDIPFDPLAHFGDSLDTLNVRLQWAGSDPDGDALMYHLYWGNDHSLPHSATDLDSTRYRLIDLPQPHQYYWKVLAEDEHGASSEGPFWFFARNYVITNRPPDVPSNPYPPDGEECVDPPEVLVEWECEDPDGDEVTYEVRFGTVPSVPGRGEGNPDRSWPWTPIFWGLQYYWQIVAVDEHDATTEGPVWTFRTRIPCDPVCSPDNTSPRAPQDPSPPDQAVGVNAPEPWHRVQVSWSCSDPEGDELEYVVKSGLSPDRLFDCLQFEEDTYHVSPVFENGWPYYWQVIARDPDGCQTEGPIWTFRSSLAVDFRGVGCGWFYGLGGSDDYMQAVAEAWGEFLYMGESPCYEYSNYVGQWFSVGHPLYGNPAYYGTRYEGQYKTNEYDLESKDGYSEAYLRISTSLTNPPGDRKFLVPFHLQVWIDGNLAGEHLMQKTFGDAGVVSIELPLDIGMVATGTDVPVMITTREFRSENPAPETPPEMEFLQAAYYDQNLLVLLPRIILK